MKKAFSKLRKGVSKYAAILFACVFGMIWGGVLTCWIVSSQIVECVRAAECRGPIDSSTLSSIAELAKNSKEAAIIFGVVGIAISVYKIAYPATLRAAR